MRQTATKTATTKVTAPNTEATKAPATTKNPTPRSAAKAANVEVVASPPAPARRRVAVAQEKKEIEPKVVPPAPEEDAPDEVVSAAPVLVAGRLTGQMWRDSSRRGIAYVEGRAGLERVMTATGRVAAQPTRRTSGGDSETLADGIMAVYTDRRGRPFAWQVRFDLGLWEAVTAALQSAD